MSSAREWETMNNARCDSILGEYGNPNVTKLLSKFKLKGVKAQILQHIEGAKGQSCKLKGAKVQSCIWKGAKGQAHKLKSCGWHIKLLL